MEFEIVTGPLAEQETDCLIVGIAPERTLTAAAKALDVASGGALSEVVASGDQSGDAGQPLMLYRVPGIKAQRVMLVGLGEAEKRKDPAYRKLIGAVVGSLKSSNVGKATFCLDEAVLNRDTYWQVRQLVEVVSQELYRFTQLKSDGDKKPVKLTSVAISLPDEEVETGELAILEGAALANGISTARDLGNLPGNICTPSYLAEQALELASIYSSVTTTVLEEEEMAKLGMETLLSVAAGSDQPAKLIVMEYRGAGDQEKPQVLVGKGITFDSGGISLKPGEAMDEMKYDMCGAASVIGALTAVAELNLPLNVVGVIPAAENLPSGKATKPGDIVTTLSGKTVEILNTDAEGRLVLCDALTYVERFKPAAVIDIATLTGACIIALGHQASGLLANDDDLADQLLAAGTYAGDRAWRLPLWDAYQEQLESNFADLANIGGRPAGTITAACFLSRFTESFHWAHLDIAGTAWKSGKEKGATGRCVPLLVQYLIDRANA